MDQSEDRAVQPLVTSRARADMLAVSLMFVFVMSAVTLSLMPIVTNQLRTDFALTDAQIGLLTSVFMGFYGAAGIISGVLAARWGGRLLALSSACFVVGSLIFALSSGFGGFLTGRAIQGIGGGMVVATCNPVLAHALPGKWLGRAWGIVGLGFGLGTMFALFALPPIQAAGGYQATLFTIAGLAFVIAVATLSQKPVRAKPSHADMATTFRGLAGALGRVLSNHRVVLLGFCNTAGLAMGVAALAWAPSYLQDAYKASESTSLYLVATVGAAQVIGNALGPLAARFLGKFWVLVAGVAGALVATMLIGLVPGAPLVVVLVFVSAVFGMLFFPVMLAYIPEVVHNPGHVGPATGVNSSFGFVGSLVAPWLFGLILDAGSRSDRAYLAGFLMLGLFGLAALAGMVFFKPGSVPATQEARDAQVRDGAGSKPGRADVGPGGRG